MPSGQCQVHRPRIFVSLGFAPPAQAVPRSCAGTSSRAKPNHNCPSSLYLSPSEAQNHGLNPELHGHHLVTRPLAPSHLGQEITKVKALRVGFDHIRDLPGRQPLPKQVSTWKRYPRSFSTWSVPKRSEGSEHHNSMVTRASLSMTAFSASRSLSQKRETAQGGEG